MIFKIFLVVSMPFCFLKEIRGKVKARRSVRNKSKQQWMRFTGGEVTSLTSHLDGDLPLGVTLFSVAQSTVTIFEHFENSNAYSSPMFDSMHATKERSMIRTVCVASASVRSQDKASRLQRGTRNIYLCL